MQQNVSFILTLLPRYLRWFWKGDKLRGKKKQAKGKTTEIHQVAFSLSKAGADREVYLHGALEGVVVAGDVGHDLTLVRLLVSQQV